MSTIEQPIESVLIQEANFLSAAPIITHTQQIATSLLLRRASNELESLQKACAEFREVAEHCSTHTIHSISVFSHEDKTCTTCQKIDHALSTDCGKDYIHKSQLEAASKRVEKMQEALKKIFDCFTNEGTKMRRLAAEALENEKAFNTPTAP